MLKIKHNTALKMFTGMVVVITLAACTKQSWYQGAQSAQTAQCMKEPLSEYEDCNQQSKESYQDYKNKRDQLDTNNESN